MFDFSSLGKFLTRSSSQDGRPEAGSRFALSWPLLVALTLVLVCAVAWAFFMGYMVGKGENPNDSISAFTGIGEDKGEIGSAGIAENGEALQGEAELKVENTPGGNMSAALAPASANLDEKKPRVAQASPPKPAAKPAPRLPRANPGQKYNYTFQVAAVRNNAEAEKLRKDLTAKKLRASFHKSGKVYLVMVNLRGDLNDIDNMQDKLKSLGLGKPLQVGRKPLDQPGRNR